MNSLDELEIRSLSFFRTNRSVVVNLGHVREFSHWTDGKYCLVLDDLPPTEVILSRGRVREFKKRLGLG